MEKFLEQLRAARKENIDGQRYIPRPVIDKLTSRDTISRIIREKNLSIRETDPYFAKSLQESLRETIHTQAKVAFAISCFAEPKSVHRLPKLISQVRRHEGGSEVDHRLPFTRNTLREYQFTDDEANTFFQVQWQFIAPKVRLGALEVDDYPKEVILPFYRSPAEHETPRAGAFGTVAEICVEQGHQLEPVYINRIVRKQFHPDISRTSFEGELRNLCILSSAKHENIIQLLSAYIHKDSFNLIFPLASHGTLEDLFHSDVSSSATFMAPEFSMVMALSGLASALVTMHEFKLEAFHLIGCHRDLKPANILVDGDRLLLADFGLSRIAQGTSGSTAPPVASDFIAPEHEDRDFTRHRIGRASDIWALGCVLLMVLVFSLDGKPGLERLWVQRGTSWDHYAHRCFHDYSRRNLALEEPFQKLASHRSASVRCLLYLVKRMLIQEPRMRPKATTVDAHIKCTAIHLLSTAIDGAFKEACKSGYIHVHLESYRFRGWRSAVKINGSDAPEFHEGSLYAHYGEFKATLDHLEVLQKLLAGFSNGFINQGPRAFLPVKSRIDRLLGSLNDETRLDAVAYTEFMMLKSEKRSRFQDLHHLPEENIDDHIRSKITTRREILRPSQGDRYVDMYELTPRPEAHVLSKVELLGKGHSTPKLLLAEEASHRDPQKISSRLREIANLLSVSAKAGSFNVLRCCGYYHKPYEIRSGLLYELPSVEKVDLERIVTLREMLRNRTDTWCLGDRFILARGLANAVFELHSVSWLHRNITTSNIIFFHRGEGATVDAESFYFVGFAQSRSNRALTDSDGHASRAFDEDYYQHPDYLSKDQGYDEKHDYYSLGIVLLEIGLWQLCDDAVCVLRSDSSARDIAIQQLVPQLGPRVGSYYRDAVMACLDDTLTDTASLLQEQQLPLVFRTQVVERLSRDKCRA